MPRIFLSMRLLEMGFEIACSGFVGIWAVRVTCDTIERRKGDEKKISQEDNGNGMMMSISVKWRREVREKKDWYSV